MFAGTDRDMIERKKITTMIMTGVVAACLSAAAPLPANAAALQSQNAAAGAAQQSNQSSDLDITRNVRRALIKDKSLSVKAHNVTIITKGGKVTLKGRVDSASEKQTVASAASNIAGVGNVDDQLTSNTQ
jgi:hyperosmotically inducible protein